jgi:hypothetical protein
MNVKNSITQIRRKKMAFLPSNYYGKQKQIHYFLIFQIIIQVRYDIHEGFSINENNCKKYHLCCYIPI